MPRRTPKQAARGKQAKFKLDKGLLDADCMRDDAYFDTAISHLEGHLRNPGVDTSELLREVISMPRILEIFIHGISLESYTMLVDRLEDTFPRTATSFGSSLASALLDKLSTFFCSFHTPLFDEHLRRFQRVRPLLAELASVSPVSDAGEQQGPVHGGRNCGRVSQKQAKKAKRAQQLLRFDRRSFDDWGVKVPASAGEALDMARKALQEMLELLKKYMAALREPEHREHIRGGCARNHLTNGDLASTEAPGKVPGETEGSFITLDELPDIPSAYSKLQLGSGLYVDNPEDFGPWRILRSGRFCGQLRSTYKDNPDLHDIIRKKLKELSHGHFSADNHKRLRGSDKGVHVFEAKMTGDTRLVYYIALVKEFGSDVTVHKQVLRIMGKYSHAQIARPHFWDAISRSYPGNKLERELCNRRSKQPRPGDDVVEPLTFTDKDIAEKIDRDDEHDEHDEQLPDLSAQERLELQAFRTEKYEPFSTAFLRGIIEDEDVTHPFYVSSQEHEVIQHPGACYVIGRSGTGKTTTLVYRMVDLEVLSRDQNLPRRQVFDTRSRVLAEHVERSFTKLCKDAHIDHSTGEDLGLVDKDEEERRRSRLPRRFCDLTDEHFPLFVSTDQFYRLLGEDCNDIVDAQNRMKTGTLLETDVDIFMEEDLRPVPLNVISYATFSSSYWGQFSMQQKKGLEAPAVYSEFIGVIKGSKTAILSPNGHLDRESYRGISDRRSSFISRKDDIYSLFEAYSKMLALRGQADEADRSQALIHNIKTLKKHRVPGAPTVDFIYVDEVQDHLLVDACIMRLICRYAEGAFWAGDTAQTISAGSSFQFNELRSLIYEMEKGSKRSNGKVFRLTENYRSHRGIVRCANTIVKLVSRFWPNTIDALAEETARQDGLVPTFFSGKRGERPPLEEFMSDDGKHAIEFGAKQCVLVRDTATRDRIYSEHGNIGIVLTVLDCKGLEFDDVVLYNFFEDSELSVSQWRLVLSECDDPKHKCPDFDEVKHHGLCRELKLLYVAITRARSHVWILDYSDKGEPMRTLWQHKKQIEIWTPGSHIPRLAESSSSAEWADIAERLFHERKYLEAMRAFEKAGMPGRKAASEAYNLRALAESVERTGPSRETNRRSAHAEAARAFLVAADLAILPEERKVYARISGECFAEAGDDINAATSFEEAKEYSLSAKYFRATGSFDEAIRLTQEHKADMQPELVAQILNVSKLHYLQSGQLIKAQELFDSVEETAEFTRLYGLDAPLAALYESHDRPAEAAETHLQLGHLDKAVDLFLEAGKKDVANMHRACSCILDELWRGMPMGTRLSADHPRMRQLLQLRARLPSDSLSDVEKLQLSMFYLIAHDNIKELQRLGQRCIMRHPGIGIRCLDHVFSTESVYATFASSQPSGTGEMLNIFSSYIGTLRSFASLERPRDNPSMQKLLAFSRNPETGMYVVLRPTPLEPQLPWWGVVTGENPGVSLTVAPESMDRVIRTFLRTLLLARVRLENEAFMLSPLSRQPCLVFALEGRCSGAQHLHIPLAALSKSFRVLSLLVWAQIHICAHACGVDSPSFDIPQQRFWLSRLYQCWQTPIGNVGSVLREPTRDNRIIDRWLRDVLFALAPCTTISYTPEGFLTALLRYWMLSRAAMRGEYPPYARRLPCVTTPFPTWLERLPDGVHITQDLLSFFMCEFRGMSTCVGVLRHIVWRPVEISVLCDFLDTVSSSYVVIHRARTARTFHGIVLPRHWMIDVSKLFSESTFRKEADAAVEYIKIEGVLIWRLITGLNTGNLMIPRPRYMTSRIYITRICQNLAIVGYNVQDPAVQDEIFRLLLSLNTPGVHWLYRKLAAVTTWDQLIDIVDTNAFEFSVGDVIQLAERGKLATTPLPVRQFTRIVYKEISEISAQLTSVVLGGAESCTAQAFQDSISPDAFVEEHPRDVDPNDEDDLSAITVLEEAETRFASYTKEDRAVLRRALAILLSRREKRRFASSWATPGTISILRTQHFSAFLEQGRKMDWSGPLRRFYRKLYLGPVPHVMVALHFILDYLRQKMRETTQRLGGKLGHEADLDAIHTEVVRLKGFSSTAEQHKESLCPLADVHREAARERLEQIVSEVQIFARIVSEDPGMRWEDDLAIAVKGILPRGVAASVTRPDGELIM